MDSFEKTTGSVLVIGLDGASFTLLGPWLEKGELPYLSRIYHEGVWGSLHSTIPPLSPEAWSTFMTGKHPGEHGIMGFVSPQGNEHELRFNCGAQIRARTIWQILSEAGKRVGIMAVPMTYPPTPVNGYLVSGLETPAARSNFTYPTELAGELRRAIGGFDLHGDFVDQTDPSAYLDRLLDMLDNHTRAARYLLSHYPADLSVFVIGATDRVQHCFWRFADPSHPCFDSTASPDLATAIKHAYQRLDADLETIVAQLPEPRTVIIMSDHGFGPCHKQVHLDRWLQQNGYLVCSPGRQLPANMLARLWASASKRLPRSVKDLLKHSLPSLRRQLASYLMFNQVEWSRTAAFTISSQHGYIYLNRRDRFTAGAVAPGEVDGVCSEIATRLQSFLDPDTGEPVVDRVIRTQEIYPGPAAADLPDLIVLWRDGYIAREQAGRASRDASCPDTSTLIEPIGESFSDWSGSHRMDGILLAQGPALACPGRVRDAKLIDLAPTLLYLLGEPVPGDMQGRVLEEMIHPNYLASHPINRTPGRPPTAPQPEYALSSSESSELAERLRELGYFG